MFFRKKNVDVDMSPQIEPPEPVNPAIIFELLPNNTVHCRVQWEPHSQFNADLLVKVADLINSGKLYPNIQKAIVSQGVHSGDVELSNFIVKNMSDPAALEDSKPKIPAGMVSRYHFTQNKLNASYQEG